MRKLLALICCLPLLMSACSSEDAEAPAALASSDGILKYVPADTPYAFVAAAPIPDEVREKFAPHVATLVPAYRTMIEESIERQAADAPGEPLADATRVRLSALVDELAGMITPEGIPAAGIGRDSTMAFYGVGLLPVLRVTVSDDALLEKAIAKLETRAGTAMQTATIDGHSYRYRGGEKGRLVVAALDDQLVVSVVPNGLSEDLFKAVLGLTLPARNIAEAGTLSALAEEYGYQAYGLGFLDTGRIANTFLDDQTGVNAELLGLANYDRAALSDVCKAEIRSMAGIVPRVVSGYTDLTAEHFVSNTVFELRSDLAAGLGTLTAPVPGLGTDHGGMVGFGMSLDLMAARDFYAARLDALEADPYECEWFADLQASVAKGRAALSRPVPAIVYGFHGFLAVIDDIEGFDIRKKQPPTDIEMRLLVATENAPGLLAMGAMFSPQLASLKIEPDSVPVEIQLPPVATATQSAYVALSDDALALAVGEGSDAGLETMLKAEPAEPSPFVSMNMDAGRYYRFVGDAAAMNDSDAFSPEYRKAMQDVIGTLGAMFSRISMDVRFTDRGVEIPSTVELAD